MWAFLWRTWVVFMPVMLVGTILSIWFFPKVLPGQQGAPPPQGLPFSPGVFFLLWLSMMSLFVLLQLVALRWTFKTKWHDFHFVAVSSEQEKKSEA